MTQPPMHPVRGVMTIRRLRVKDVAQALGVSREYVSAALCGRGRTSRRLRAGLAEMLGLPEEQLFLHEESRGVTVASAAS